MTTSEYRQSHQDDGHGRRYDQMYSRGYYRYLWQDVEKPLVDKVLADVAERTNGRQLVDFACGTGRVTVVGAPHFENVLGIDVSEDMLTSARQHRSNLKNISYERLDIQDDVAADKFVNGTGPVSCVTAFRLFTNADPALRMDAAAFAYRILMDGGILVANTHMNPRSPVGSLYRAEHAARSYLRRDQRMFNKVLDPGQLRELLLDTGFRRVEVCYYAAFPGVPKLWKFVPGGVVDRVERRFGGRSWNQCALVIAKR